MNVDTGEDRPRSYFPNGRDAAPARRRTPGWDIGPERRLGDGRTLARGLAYFSIGLGVFQLVAPGRITGFIGLDDDYDPLVRFYGAREIAQGMAILAERTPTAGIWSRLAGDVLDLGTLTAALARARPDRDRALMAMAMVAGVTALDAVAAARITGSEDRSWSREQRRLR